MDTNLQKRNTSYMDPGTPVCLYSGNDILPIRTSCSIISETSFYSTALLIHYPLGKHATDQNSIYRVCYPQWTHHGYRTYRTAVYYIRTYTVIIFTPILLRPRHRSFFLSDS